MTSVPALLVRLPRLPGLNQRLDFWRDIVACLSTRALSWFEGLAAFQAIQFAAWRDQPAKWANTLLPELLVARFHPYQLFCHNRKERERTADTGKELIKRTLHGFNSWA